MGGQEAKHKKQPVKQAQGLIEMIRFNLCQNDLESFKYNGFPDLDKSVSTTNHEDIIYLVGYIC